MSDITTIVHLASKAYAVYKAITSNSDCQPGNVCKKDNVVDYFEAAMNYFQGESSFEAVPSKADFWPLGHSPLKICPSTDKCTIEDIYEGQEGSVNSCRENQVIIEIFKVDDDTFVADDTAATPRIPIDLTY